MIEDTFALESRLERIDDARRWFAGHADAEGLTEGERWALELALTEALANVIQHAYGGGTDGRIELALLIDATRVELAIRDFGARFDPAEHEVEDLATPRTGGYGLHLMKEVLDAVDADTSVEQGTLLRLTKRRSP